MIRFIIIVIIAIAAFWCCNNIDFSSIVNKTGKAVQNEKTIKAVTEKRQFDYNQEQDVMNN